MSDLISRQAAIDALVEPKVIDVYDHYWDGRNTQYKNDVDAITDLPSAQHNTDYSDGYADGYKQGIKDAQPEERTNERTETHACDCISRQAAIDAVIEWYGCEPSDMDYFVKILAKQPSAQPERKKGKWIHEIKHHKSEEQEFDYYEIRCSECGVFKRIGWSDARYCPNCGADMRGE